MRGSATRATCATLLLLVTTTACDRLLQRPPDLSLPELTTVAEVYSQHGLDADYRYSGNVLELVVQQPPDQLRRGGPLWARVGPYIYLFTPATRTLLDRYRGVGGVRAITMMADTEVARALLVRDTLNDHNWQRALALLGTALEQGTERPSTMDRLATFGEQFTRYEYNTAYVQPRRN